MTSFIQDEKKKENSFIPRVKMTDRDQKTES